MSSGNRGTGKMTIYKFKIRNIEMELPEPTQEAFDEFYETMWLKFFINEEFKALIKKDLQILNDRRTTMDNWFGYTV